ncbi:hypothetical protein [Kiloniella majae]|nr:hypothetical protein [Kiloniella majae]
MTFLKAESYVLRDLETGAKQSREELENKSDDLDVLLPVID